MVKRYTISLSLVGALVLSSHTPCVAQSMSSGVPTQISVGLGNTQADGRSSEVAVSPNSGIAAFSSAASNLVEGDTNQVDDIFVRASNGVITRESVSSDGVQADGKSGSPALSQVTANGAYGIAFVSQASNFVSGMSSQELGIDQVYLRLPHIKKTILISRAYPESGFVAAVGTCGQPQVVALDNGTTFYVAFHSNAFNLVSGAVPPPNVNGYRPNRIFFATVTVNGQEAKVEKLDAFTGVNGVQADGELREPVLSGYADKMLFRTDARNLGWSNPNGVFNVAEAVKGGAVSLISKGPVDGAPGDRFSDSPAMNFSGTVYVFRTLASNIFGATPNNPSLVSYSTESKTYALINTNADGVRGDSVVHEGVKLDPKGRLVTFVDFSSNYLPAGVDTNNRDDVFVKDIKTGQIVRVNAAAGGAQEVDGKIGGAVLGTLGYSSQTATVGFLSSSSILRQVGSGQDLEVYRSLLTFSTPKLDKNTTLEAPPDVVAGVKKLTLTFQKFSASATVSSLSYVSSMATKVSYEAQLTNTTSKKKLKVVSTRNRVVLKNLTPGQYSVRYRVIGTPSKGKKITTKFSPSVTATVAAK